MTRTIGLPRSLPGAADPASPNYNGYLAGCAKSYLVEARFWARKNAKMRGYPGDEEAMRRADGARVLARMCWRAHRNRPLDGIRAWSPT